METNERNLRRDLFFEDVARAYDVGLAVGRRHVAEGKGAEDALREGLVPCLHTVFMTFDHGTKLAEHFNVYVRDEDGNELTEGALHEDFMTHLLETGRYD